MKKDNVTVGSDEGNVDRYRLTLPKAFVKENRQIINKTFVPKMSFTGNIVLKRQK